MEVHSPKCCLSGARSERQLGPIIPAFFSSLLFWLLRFFFKRKVVFFLLSFFLSVFFLSVCLSLFFSLTASHVDQAGLKLVATFLPLPPEC